MGTNTTNLNLYKPATDETGWDDEVNSNFDIIDAAITAKADAAATTTALASKADASAVPAITGTPDLGKIPIGQGDGTAAYGDPLVQGVYDPNTNVTTGGIASGPIKPVLVGGKGVDGTLKDIATDNSGVVQVAVTNTSIPITVVASQTIGLAAGSAAIGSVISNITPDLRPATQNITAQDTVSASATVANGQVLVTGTPTANSAATFALAEITTCRLLVTGTWTGSLDVESSMDGGTTWDKRSCHQPGTQAVNATGFTANFEGTANTSTCTHIRVRATAAMTGTATVRCVQSDNQHMFDIINGIQLRDPSGAASAAVKAASTAAVATDPALVVAISPNNAMQMVNVAATSGGLSFFSNAAVSGTKTAVKAGAGQLYGWQILNTTAAIAYVQIFNLAIASITVGTTVPDLVLALPASGGATFANDIGIAFSTQINIACTTTATGSTGAACAVAMFYK